MHKCKSHAKVISGFYSGVSELAENYFHEL